MPDRRSQRTAKSSIELIRDPQTIADVAQRLNEAPLIAFDTEFLRERTFYPQLGLLQLADAEESWLIDPLGVSVEDMRPLLDVLMNPDVLKAAHAHRGASFIEIFQNCVVYNDDVFAPFTDKSVAADKQLWLRAGEKMLYANGTKGLALDMDRHMLKVVDGDSDEVIVHDPKNRSVAYMLVEMPAAGFPIALGVIYEDPAPTFDSAVIEQNMAAAKGKAADLQALVSKGQTWMVEKEPRAE